MNFERVLRAFLELQDQLEPPTWQERELEITNLSSCHHRWRRWILRAIFAYESQARQALLELAADPESRVIRKAEVRRFVLEQQLAEVSRLSAEAQRLRGPTNPTGVPRVGLTNIPRLDEPGQGGGQMPLS